MSEKNKNIYSVCTDKDKVLPELWRVVFLARISNIKAIENVEVKVLSDDELAQIAQAPTPMHLHICLLCTVQDISALTIFQAS